MRSSVLCLAVVALLVTGSAPRAAAETDPIPNPGTSALGTGDTVAEACQEAAENLRDRCLFLGPISYSNARCNTLDPPGPLPPVVVCSCIATTFVCVNPL